MKWHGQPITTLKHPALLKPSGWLWNSRKRDLDAARWWGLIPSRFYSLDRDDKLDTLAMYEIDWRIQAINSYEQAEESKRAAKKGRKGKRG